MYIRVINADRESVKYHHRSYIWMSQSTRTTLLKGRDVFVQKNGSDKICRRFCRRISGDLSDGDLEFDLEVDLGHNSRSKYRFIIQM